MNFKASYNGLGELCIYQEGSENPGLTVPVNMAKRAEARAARGSEIRRPKQVFIDGNRYLFTKKEWSRIMDSGRFEKAINRQLASIDLSQVKINKGSAKGNQDAVERIFLSVVH